MNHSATHATASGLAGGEIKQNVGLTPGELDAVIGHIRTLGDMSHAPSLDGGWIPWGGGVCPVETGVLGEVKFRNNSIGTMSRIAGYNWLLDGRAGDIIAYRVPVAKAPSDCSIGRCEHPGCTSSRAPECNPSGAAIPTPSPGHPPTADELDPRRLILPPSVQAIPTPITDAFAEARDIKWDWFELGARFSVLCRALERKLTVALRERDEAIASMEEQNRGKSLFERKANALRAELETERGHLEQMTAAANTVHAELEAVKQRNEQNDKLRAAWQEQAEALTARAERLSADLTTARAEIEELEEACGAECDRHRLTMDLLGKEQARGVEKDAEIARLREALTKLRPRVMQEGSAEDNLDCAIDEVLRERVVPRMNPATIMGFDEPTYSVNPVAKPQPFSLSTLPGFTLAPRDLAPLPVVGDFPQ